MITNPENITASPRPWQVREECDLHYRHGTFSHVEDANGGTIAVTITARCDVDAALIVESVNERDALRDLVRRLADRLEHYHIVGKDDHALISEARKTLGDAK